MIPRTAVERRAPAGSGRPAHAPKPARSLAQAGGAPAGSIIRLTRPIPSAASPTAGERRPGRRFAVRRQAGQPATGDQAVGSRFDAMPVSSPRPWPVERQTRQRPRPQSPIVLGVRRPRSSASPSAASPTAGERLAVQAGQRPRPRPANGDQAVGSRFDAKPVSALPTAVGSRFNAMRSAASSARGSTPSRQAPCTREARLDPSLSRRKSSYVNDRVCGRSPPPPRSRLALSPGCRYTYPRKPPYFLTLRASHSPIANIRNVFIQVLID
jgi:hypothetical protein